MRSGVPARKSPPATPKRFLVAGGAGFIGSNLVARLLQEGHSVVAVDNFLTGDKRNLHGTDVPFEKVDCAKPAYLERFAKEPFDVVVHLAGASSVGLFDEDPLRAQQAIAAFQNSLEIARAAKAKVAFASTSSFYARCPKPFREDMHLIPATLYEFSKLAMEELAQAYWHRYGVESVAFRFFSVYGPNEEAKGKFANVLSQFAWAMKRGEAPVLYGDGEQTRDFTHVDDLIDGILLALRKSSGFQVYNIGTGVEHTFNEVVAMLNEALGTKIKPTYVPNPIRNYVAETLADNTKLRALGWKPKVTLKEGVRRQVQGLAGKSGR